MEATRDIRKLVAMSVLMVSAVWFGASMYAQSEMHRLTADQSANAQPIPGMLAALSALSPDRDLTLVTADSGSDQDDVGV